MFDDAVVARTREILERVRREGDTALVDLTRTLDGVDVQDRIAVPVEELDAAAAKVPTELRDAVDAMAKRVRTTHELQLPASWDEERGGTRFGQVVHALGSVGCYVPGGRAAYPSTVLMTSVPARVAGVPRVVLCTPPASDGSVPAVVLYAATVAGVDAVYRVGGAHAIAALAFGTQTIKRVDKIVGPGNVWVTAAKREVSGLVGIDGLAGPSELVIVADATANPRLLALDMIAQAEHDPLARAFLVTADTRVASEALDVLERELGMTPRAQIVAPALANGAVILVRDEEHAADVIEHLAPEHLEILTAEPRRFLDSVRSYGAAFLGPWTPVTLGDYGVGSNHVLPTMGTARFSSGLRTEDFTTISYVLESTEAGLRAVGPAVEAIAHAEGLEGHARASQERRSAKSPLNRARPGAT